MSIHQRLIFRLYGDFTVQSADSTDVRLPHGTLDILDTRGHKLTGASRTLLRWRASSSDLDEKGVPYSRLLNWHAQSDDVRRLFTQASAGSITEIVFDISAPLDAGVGFLGQPRKLTIFGITALDRIEPDSMADPRPVADMRIPCVPKTSSAARAQLRVGQSSRTGLPDYVYTLRASVPLPARIGQSGTGEDCLTVSGDFETNEPDLGQLQRPMLVYINTTAANEDIEEFDGDGPRFGDFDSETDVAGADFSFAHSPTGRQLKLKPTTLVRVEEPLKSLGLLSSGARAKPPSTAVWTRHRVSLRAATESGVGMRIETVSAVERSPVTLEAQLGAQIASTRGLVVRTAFEVTATERQLRQPNAGAPFSCSAEVTLTGETDPSGDLKLEEANEWMARERAALVLTKAEPQSFLPDLKLDNAPRRVAFHTAIGLRARMAPGGAAHFEPDPTLGQVPTAAVTLAARALNGQDQSAIPVGVSFPGVARDATLDGGHSFHLSLTPEASFLKGSYRPPHSALRFGVSNREVRADHLGSHTTPFRGRLGSLDLRGVSGERGVRLLDADTEGALELRPDPNPQGTRHALEITLPLALEDVRPVTSDLPHGDRDLLRQDWLVPAVEPKPGASAETMRFVLRVTEQLSADQDHHLTAKLFESSPDGTGGFDDVLVTRAPFGMMRLRRPSFDALASDASSNVATYDSDDRVWQFRAGGDLIPISFPASATGESMDKPGQRKIGDGSLDDVIRSRLSGPATVWIDTAAFGRNFRTPEHNARALFGDRTELGPGAELAGFATELVYGLATAWQRQVNTTALSSVVRLAETGTLMGRIVTPLDDTDTPSPELKDRFPKLTAAVAERSQHIEAISRVPGTEATFQAARFEENLAFRARHTAVIAPPMEGVENAAQTSAARPGPKIAQHGLDGGAFWGIEQRAFLQSLMRDPSSDLGEVEGLAFGPFGTTGTQTVRFVNGSLAIITEAVQGRLSRLRVEVTGRIGAFYHNAKHVVVYRRTTAASDQFEGLGGITRRPVLRKVEEYIDVQEPVRSYPDRPGADPRSAGPLRELRFGTTRINVDSAWSEEVGRDGWRVPLWNRHAADERPVVYPKPEITVALQGEDVERLTLQALCDPEKLCFYTNAVFAEDQRDTNLWPAVHGVDGFERNTVAGWAKAQDEAALNGTLNGRRASASRFVPGVVAFTHCLSASSALTKVNEARSDKPVFVAVESFTFLRGGQEEPAPEAETLLKELAGMEGLVGAIDAHTPDLVGSPKDVLGKIDEARVAFETARELIRSGAVWDLLEGTVRTAFEDFKSENNLADLDAKLTAEALEKLETLVSQPGFEVFKEALEANPPTTLRELIESDITKADLWKEVANDYADKIEDEIGSITSLDTTEAGELEKKLFGSKLQDLRTKAKEAQKVYGEVKKLLDASKSDCDALADTAIAQIDAKALLYREQLTSAAAEARRLLETSATTKQVRDELKKLKETVKAQVDENANRIGDEFGKVRALATDARALVADWGADLDRAYASGQERLAQFKHAYKTDRPWSPQRLDKAQASLATELRNLKTEASAALAQTRQRLASQIDETAAEATTAIDRELRIARKELGSGSPAARAAGLLLGTSASQLGALAKAAEEVDVSAVLARLQTAIDAEGNAARKRELQALKGDVDRLASQGRALKGKVEETADFGAEQLEKDLKEIAARAKALVAVASNGAHAFAQLESALQQDLNTLFTDLNDPIEEMSKEVRKRLEDIGALFDELVAGADGWITQKAAQVAGFTKKAQGAADAWLASVEGKITAASDKLTGALKKRVNETIIDPLFKNLTEAMDGVDDALEPPRAKLKDAIDLFEDGLADALEALSGLSKELVQEAKDLCRALVAQKEALRKAIKDDVREFLNERLGAYKEKLRELGNTIAGAFEDIRTVLDDSVDAVGEAATRLMTAVTREIEGAAQALGEVGQALADDIGRLVAAGVKLPDIGGLGLDTDRVLAIFKDLAPDIDISSVTSTLDRLGDALGAFGAKLPVTGLGDGFGLPDLSDVTKYLPDFNIDDLLPNIAGLNFKDMVPDFGGAGNSFDKLSKYFKVTHDLDKKAKTAWAKAELDIPFPKRAKLFGFGPFTLFFNKPKLVAWVRVEANAKTKDVTTSERGEVTTDIEAVVSGQPMVTLRAVQILYTKDGGLDFKIDPKNIRLHPNFQFIQDMLDGLGLDFGDNGPAFIKDGGVPVGIEHKLALPIPSVSAGTSGVTDLTILNAFRLVAYPNFEVANRFNLSTQELPFNFAIFIIGGTGFIQLDVKHEPAEKLTEIVVAAGVGGSASLSFAFGPVSGGVYITLTVILTYRKYLPRPQGKTDAGLSVALELAIYGHVSLWGLATIMLRLALSMTYHESGRVDANGRLSVTLRVSRFFKLKYRTSVTYRLRDGKSVTVRTEEVSAELDPELKNRADKLKKARAKLK